MERLRAAMPEVQFSFAGDLAIDGKMKDGLSIKLGLDRVWQFCQRNREHCAEGTDRYVAGIVESIREQARPVERAMLRLAVRPENYVEEARRQMAAAKGADKTPMYARRLIADLWIVPMVDMPRAMRFAGAEDLKALKMSEEELFQAGRANLLATQRPLRTVAAKPAPGEVGRLGEDDYESSRVLLHGEWAELAGRMVQLVVMVPSANLLLYADAGDPAALSALRALGREAYYRAPRAISETLLRWTVAGWEVLR